MSELIDRERDSTTGTSESAPDVPTIVTEAGRQLRAPWAAGIAGVLFAIMFTAALWLLRNQPMMTADDAGLIRLFANGEDLGALIGGLYLAPFAGIMFLWFIAVIRDQVGEREDRFFATVFLGSGLIFVAMLFTTAAVASIPVVGSRYLGLPPPTAAEIVVLREFSYGLLFAFSTRAAAVFLFATATIGVRSGAFPRWFAWTGYALGVVLFVAVSFLEWSILVLPAWVAVVSVFILRRERARRQTA